MVKKKRKKVAEKPAKLTLLDKLVLRIRKFGVSERKATEIAKALVPVARTAVKAEVRAKVKVAENKRLRAGYEAEKTGEDVAVLVTPDTDADLEAAENAAVDKVITAAVKVNGFSLRLDLPVVKMPGIKEIEMLRVVDGLTSVATYIVAAVKGADGFVAVRRLRQDYFNVKFYPDFKFWGKTEEELASLGAQDQLKRQYYERMHFSGAALEQLLGRLHAEAQPKSRVKAVLDRFLAITVKPLIKAFDILYKEKSHAA